MLFKLSLKNIKKSFKDYAIYFFTLILVTKVIYFYKTGELHSFILTIFVCILYHFLKRKISFWYKMNIDCSV